MVARPELLRQPLFFHRPELASLSEPEQYYLSLIEPILDQFFLNPFFSEQRQQWGSLLERLYNDPQAAREIGDGLVDVLYVIATLQHLLTTFGLAMGDEVERIRDRKNTSFDLINPDQKYSGIDELEILTAQWHKAGKKIGLVHGAFDPPHIGHSRLFYLVWPYCDVLLIGVDPDELLKLRKGTDRPRIPLLARLWQIASLPTVQKVFIIPINNQNNRDFVELYERLHVSVVGCGGDNPLLPEYKRRMQHIGGHVIVADTWKFSSTKMTEDLSNEKLWEQTVLRIPDILEKAQRYKALALERWGNLLH